MNVAVAAFTALSLSAAPPALVELPERYSVTTGADVSGEPWGANTAVAAIVDEALSANAPPPAVCSLPTPSQIRRRRRCIPGCPGTSPRAFSRSVGSRSISATSTSPWA